MPKNHSIIIDWKPDKSIKTPVYMQIVDYVKEKVSSGDWPVGTRLPSQRAMSKQFDVNRSTIITAIEELNSYGITSGNHGAGTIIESNTWSLLLESSPNWNQYLKSGFFKANNETIQTINKVEFEENIIRLGTGEIDTRLFPKDIWSKIMQKLSKSVDSLAYLEPLGYFGLRTAIAAHMEKLGVKTNPSSILITSGSLQALQLISACLLHEDATVYTEAPSYVKSLQVFQSAGMKLAGIPMSETGMTFEKLSHIPLSNRKQDSSIVYTIPTNHNPTGITMPDDRREKFVKFCAENRIPVIEDGAYHELCYEGKQPKTMKEMDKYGTVIYLGTLSKSFAPGLRIGWVIAPEPIVQRLGDVKMQMDYGASSTSQYITEELLVSGMYEEYLEKLKSELLKRRDNAINVLEKHFSDFAKWRKPKGGFYIWTTFKVDISIDKLFQKAMDNNILLNPGDIYDFKHNHSLRLSYAYTTCEEFESATIKLAEIIKRLIKK